jgi:hypothetical protein
MLDILIFNNIDYINNITNKKTKDTSSFTNTYIRQTLLQMMQTNH